MARIDLSDLFAKPYEAARAAKRQGRWIVGVVSNNVPVELIDAAGAFAVQLAPHEGPTPRTDAYMEALFDPMLRSVFEQILAGELDFLDAIALPRSIDSAQRIYYYLCELQRTGAAKPPAPILYDVQKLPNETSRAYTRARTRDFKQALEALTGREITEPALRQSIGAYNALRGQYEALGVARAQGRVSSADAMRAMAIAPTLAPEAAAQLLGELSGAPDAGKNDASKNGAGKKIVLIGSAHHAPHAHEALARAGAHVVGDFHWRGDLFYGPEIKGPDIDAGASPLDAVADHYWRNSYSVRDYPAPVDALVSFVKARNAEAALFFFYKEEEALVWDLPAQTHALEAAGVRTMALSLQAYPPTFDEAALAAFVRGRT